MGLAFVAVVMGVALAACGRAPQEETRAPEAEGTPAAPQKDIGGQAADVASDTQALEAAQEAASPVVRSAGDCGQAREELSRAESRLDEIAPDIRTEAGKVAFDAIRKRVRDVAQLCP
jgi:hypothetical protein